MTYRIEITAPTVSELAGKLIALGAQLGAPTLAHAAPEVQTTESEVVEMDDAPLPEGKPEPGNVEREMASQAVVYDYDKQVAPRVLEMVSKRGRDAVKDLLSRFGVVRASELDASRYGELMDAVNAAMED